MKYDNIVVRFFKQKWYCKHCKSYSEAEDYFEDKMLHNEKVLLFVGKNCIRKYNKGA